VESFMDISSTQLNILLGTKKPSVILSF